MYTVRVGVHLKVNFTTPPDTVIYTIYINTIKCTK